VLESKGLVEAKKSADVPLAPEEELEEAEV
jgi:hypothetical protein